MTKQKLTFLSSTKNNITFLATIIQHLSNDFMVKYELYKKHKKTMRTQLYLKDNFVFHNTCLL